MTFLLNPYVFSSATAKDPYWANVVNLIGFENGLTDEKTGQNWLSNEAWALSSSAAKFGAYGLPATNTNRAYKYYPATHIITPAGAEWIAEFWARPITNGNFNTFFQITDNSFVPSLSVNYDNTQTSKIQLTVKGATVTTPTISGLFDGNYKYFAVYKGLGSSTIGLYIDGVIRASLVMDSTAYGSYAVIGAWAQIADYPARADIDELRITAGGARGAPTIIPTTAFPRS